MIAVNLTIRVDRDQLLRMRRAVAGQSAGGATDHQVVQAFATAGVCCPDGILRPFAIGWLHAELTEQHESEKGSDK
jgi:hypothetical protein